MNDAHVWLGWLVPPIVVPALLALLIAAYAAHQSYFPSLPG